MAAPATPPTIPPTRTGVGGVLLPPEPPPELDVGEGAVPVLLVPPTPPATVPVLEALPDTEDADADWLKNCDEADADEARLVGLVVVWVAYDPEPRL